MPDMDGTHPHLEQTRMFSKSNSKQLDQIYQCHEDYVSGLEIACRSGCAACCTRNVTLTGLEGERILAELKSRQRGDILEQLRAVVSFPRYQPPVTVNQMAHLCARGLDPPESEIDPNWGACPLLEDDICPVYTVRPFECRAMISTTDCRRTGRADMPPETVSVNNIFRQFIEHIDATGFSGNLTDVLLALETGSNRLLIRNRPIPVVIADPAHRSVIEPLLSQLQRICTGSG